MTAPLLLITSSRDPNSLDEICQAGDNPSWAGQVLLTYHANVSLTDACAHAQWAAELDTVSRALAAARPDLGLFVVNCPLHVAVVEQNSYVEMKVGEISKSLATCMI